MTNQVKLFKEGHLPVFCTEKEKRWSRIPIALQQNGVVKGEEGFQLTFRHAFNAKTKYYFAFSYSWTCEENNKMIKNLVETYSEKYFCNYRHLTRTFKKTELNILTVTKIVENNSIEVKEIKELQEF